jgi:hypothetical protein
MLLAAAQWRETTPDAVYTQPDIPVPNTAGRPGAYTGRYDQVRVDWTIDRATSFAVGVHFATRRSQLFLIGFRRSDLAGQPRTCMDFAGQRLADFPLLNSLAAYRSRWFRSRMAKAAADLLFKLKAWTPRAI